MGKAVKIVFHEDKIIKILGKSTEVRLNALGRYLTRYARRLVGRGQPRKYSRNRLTGEKTRLHGTRPSLPGEPPKKVTGTLQNSITFEVVRSIHNISLFIGVRKGTAGGDGKPGTGYAGALEFGGPKIRRPFLRPTIENNKPLIKRLYEGRIFGKA